MWVWKILTNHHLAFQPGCRLTKGPDKNYSRDTYWQKILVSESEPLHPGNGEVQHILTATKMTSAVVFQLEVWGCVLWPWKKKEKRACYWNQKHKTWEESRRLETDGRVSKVSETAQEKITAINFPGRETGLNYRRAEENHGEMRRRAIDGARSKAS